MFFVCFPFVHEDETSFQLYSGVFYVSLQSENENIGHILWMFLQSLGLITTQAEL